MKTEFLKASGWKGKQASDAFYYLQNVLHGDTTNANFPKRRIPALERRSELSAMAQIIRDEADRCREKWEEERRLNGGIEPRFNRWSAEKMEIKKHEREQRRQKRRHEFAVRILNLKRALKKAILTDLPSAKQETRRVREYYAIGEKSEAWLKATHPRIYDERDAVKRIEKRNATEQLHKALAKTRWIRAEIEIAKETCRKKTYRKNMQ